MLIRKNWSLFALRPYLLRIRPFLPKRKVKWNASFGEMVRPFLEKMTHIIIRDIMTKKNT